MQQSIIGLASCEGYMLLMCSWEKLWIFDMIYWDIVMDCCRYMYKMNKIVSVHTWGKVLGSLSGHGKRRATFQFGCFIKLLSVEQSKVMQSLSNVYP